MSVFERLALAAVFLICGSALSAILGFSVGQVGSAHFWGAIVWALGCAVGFRLITTV